MIKHLLDIRSLNREQLLFLLENADKFCEVSERSLKKVPALRGKTIILLFLEPSTRTRASFEIAGKRLSADTINISASGSSVVKGESLYDTARTLEAMAPDILVMRHPQSGAAHFLSRILKYTAVVNAGDGMHEHPTQALLDCLTLKQFFNSKGQELQGKTVAIVGDILHSRVARSNIWAHLLLGNKVRLVGPPTLLPSDFSNMQVWGEHLSVHHRLADGIQGADVVMALRMQLERQKGHFISNTDEYSRYYGINESVLQRYAPDAVVMHPGPLNRGVELSSEVADGPRSLISKQVANGVAVRMAALFALAASRQEAELEAA